MVEIASVLKDRVDFKWRARKGSVFPEKCLTHFSPRAGAIRSLSSNPFSKLAVETKKAAYRSRQLFCNHYNGGLGWRSLEPHAHLLLLD